MNTEFKALLESDKYAPLSEMEMNTLAVVMANTAKETERELSEGTIAADVAQFTPFLMPMLRRIYPALIANELLGVQPMSGPTGFIYSLTNRYVGNQAAPVNPNRYSQVLRIPRGTLNAGVNDALLVGTTLTSGTVVGKIVYAEPQYHASNPSANGTTEAGNVGTNGNVYDKTNAAFFDTVLVDTSFGTGKFATGDVVVASGGTEVIADTLTVTTFSNEAAWLKVLPNYSGSYTTANGEIRGTVNNEMNEVGISVERKQVEARTRKLRAEYTIEMYQDLKAMHGILADQELMSLMGYEIKAETDREIVDFVNYNALQYGDYKLAGNTGEAVGEQQTGRYELERYRAFAILLSNESREIGRRNRRGAANKLLVSPKVLTVLEQLGGFNPTPVDSTVNPQLANSSVVGRFDNKFDVIVDNFAKSEYATLVYKGSNQDSMGVYAPYTPVQIQKVTHVTTGQPALIAMTRYGLASTPWEPENYATTIGVIFEDTILGGSADVV